MGDVKASYNRMVTSLKENSRNIVLYPEFGNDLSQILKFMEDYFKREPKPIDVEFEVVNGNVDIGRRNKGDSAVDSGIVGEDSDGAGSNGGITD